MKIAIASDLHLERLGPYQADDILANIIMSAIDCDLIVLAGDINSNKERRDNFIAELRKYKRTFFVLGNHDYYGGEWYDDFVEDDDIVGGCLWTNFDRRNPSIESAARTSINDYRLIKNWTIDKTVEVFEEHKRKIFESPAKIVVTHFPPTWAMINQRYHADPLNGYFANSMEFDVVHSDKKLWICGHTHNRATQFIAGDCRIVSNCLGYFGELYKTPFDFKIKIVEIDL